MLFLTAPLNVEPLIGLRFSMYAQKENLSCPHGKLLIRLCGNKKRQNESQNVGLTVLPSSALLIVRSVSANSFVT